MDRLPVELLWRIFSDLDANKILAARRVCRTWRSAATAHPLFWSTVDIVSTRASELAFASVRITAAGGRAFTLSITLHKEPPARSVRRLARTLTDSSLLRWSHAAGASALGKLIARCLPYLRALEIRTYPPEWDVVLPFLMGPAPTMESFEVLVYGIGMRKTPLPPGLFGRLSPQLWKARIQADLVLPERIAVFASVRDLFLYSTWSPGAYPSLVSLLRAFPATIRLDLWGAWDIPCDLPGPPDFVTALCRLESLSFDLIEQWQQHRFARHIVPLMANLKTLQLYCPDKITLDVALDRVPPPWSIAYVRASMRLWLSIESLTSGRVVRSLFSLGDNAIYYGDRILSPQHRAKVAQVEICASVWDMLQAGPQIFQNAVELRIVLNTPRLPRACAELQTHLPALRRISLCHEGRKLHPDDAAMLQGYVARNGVDLHMNDYARS